MSGLRLIDVVEFKDINLSKIAVKTKTPRTPEEWSQLISLAVFNKSSEDLTSFENDFIHLQLARLKTRGIPNNWTMEKILFWLAN